MSLIAVCHHAHAVGGPQGNEVDSTVSPDPLCVALQVIVSMHIHILDHPLRTCSVVVIPCAVATSLLWPQIYHFTDVVHWVSNCTSRSKGECHFKRFDIVVVEIVVYMEEEIFILQPGVKRAIPSPEQELIGCKREASSKQIGESFLKWNSEQSLRW